MAEAKQEIRCVLLAQAGDREAFSELLAMVQEPLYRYLVSLTSQPSLAEDILQEVFVLIWRKLRWLREPELFRAWAYRIATHEAFKTLRRERRWSEQIRDEALLGALPAPAPEAIDQAFAAQLPQLVAALSPASRAVIALHYLHELTIDEVAAVLGIAPGTVKSRLAYGLQNLRQQLNQPSS